MAYIDSKGKWTSSMIDSWARDISITLSAFFYLSDSKIIEYDGIRLVVSSKIKNPKMLIVLCNFFQSLLITLALKKHKGTLIWSWDFTILMIKFFFKGAYLEPHIFRFSVSTCW